MVVWLVLFGAALALGALLAAAMLRDPGYVLVAYGDVTVETSFWLAIAAFLALWATAALATWLVRRSRSGSARLTGWVRGRRQRQGRQRSAQGTMLLAEQRWREAAVALKAAAQTEAGSLSDYLAAARAENGGGRFDQRDDILDEAGRALPEAAFVIDLVRSELQQAAQQWQRSAANLEALRLQAPRHPLVLRRLFEARRALGDWEAVADLASALPAEADAELGDVEVAVWRARLRNSQHSVDAAEHVRNAWKAMPKRLRDHEGLLLEYAQLAAPTDAEAALRQALQRDWRARLLSRYGTLDGDVGGRRKVAEGWLSDHPDDPDLLLTLGRLALAADQADQATDYLERSVRGRKSDEALKLLAETATRSGDHVAANGYYREAFAAASADSPDSPDSPEMMSGAGGPSAGP